MNSIEAILSLLMLLAFTAHILEIEKNLSENTKIIQGNVSEKNTSLECAALTNFYYANAGGKLGAPLKCNFVGGFAVEKKQRSPALVNGTLLPPTTIEVQPHYGKGNVLQH